MSIREQVIFRFLGLAADRSIGILARQSFLEAAVRFQRMNDEEYLAEVNAPRSFEPN